MFIRRGAPREPDRFLDWKVRLFFAGAVLLFVGMALERELIVGVGLGVLVIGFALRFFDRSRDRPFDDEEYDDDPDGSPSTDPEDPRGAA